MWKSLGIILTSPIKSQYTLLSAENLLQQQLRTTYVLKRRSPAQLHKKGNAPKTLRSRHYVYDLVQQTHVERQPDIDVILNTFVEGLGNVGDRVSVRPQFAYNELLLPGLAVYASPENIEKYKDYNSTIEEKRYSSPNALLTVKTMSRIMISVVMNKEMPWTLKPWHVKISFRKSGYIVPEDTITLPEVPITGPDLSIENKEFFVTVTVFNLIHHWSTSVTDRLPYTPFFWREPGEAIIPDQAPILATLPEKPIKIKNIQ
ncbi:hypothetical protein NQ314_018421 [Rhamnusium bicolor]|uniref:Large ribosomal subunit protein bL9m n=1 Tax=Rhamnusium bicolor TaxID=1586634 RepID=A0AAV8WS22_9CUCU|nr:hypothetical protein NQ314_018421 [Rhamnusium bicolor]